MNKTFFENIYKEALKSNLQEGNLNEMAQAYARQIRQFCEIHPEFLFLYKNPSHNAEGTPAYDAYNALVNEFYEMFPDMANTDRLDRSGNVKHQGKRTAISNAIQPIADSMLADWKAKNPGKATPTGLEAEFTSGADTAASENVSDEAKANKVAELLRQAQLLVDEMGKGDTNLANILMNAQDAVADDLLVVPASNDNTPAEAAASNTAEPEGVAGDDPFADITDNDFLGNDDAPAASEPAVEEPVTEEPAANEPPAEETAEEPVAETPEEPASNEAEEPADTGANDPFDIFNKSDDEIALDMDRYENMSDEDIAKMFND
jgi:hypothetical protein